VSPAARLRRFPTPALQRSAVLSRNL
jgi:hypothetical protein